MSIYSVNILVVYLSVMLQKALLLMDVFILVFISQDVLRFDIIITQYNKRCCVCISSLVFLSGAVWCILAGLMVGSQTFGLNLNCFHRKWMEIHLRKLDFSSLFNLLIFTFFFGEGSYYTKYFQERQRFLLVDREKILIRG